MSCILYSKSSYDALSKSSTLAKMWDELLTSSYPSPEAYAEALFNLNKQAYQDRYRIDVLDEDSSDDPIDSEFLAFLEADPNDQEQVTLAHFYKLLSRIAYQCCDVDDCDDNQTFIHLRWSKEWAAESLCKLTIDSLNESQDDQPEIVSKYSRSDAIKDGTLIDLMTNELGPVVRDAGFNYPMAMTSQAFNRYVALSPAAIQALNDEKGRLWDILGMLSYKIRGMKRNGIEDSEILFNFLCVVDNIKPTLCTLKAIIGPDDNGDPCITIMLPDQD